MIRLLNVKGQMSKSQDLSYLHFCMSCMVLQKQLYINGKKMPATRSNLYTAYSLLFNTLLQVFFGLFSYLYTFSVTFHIVGTTASNGAETNRGIACILGILLMNSYAFRDFKQQ